ncbi:hypothetical protein DFH07DRAFT_141704 [Mycena maculata]|uniref:Uncharacterized protein n=1 Tax=Mycena maculata TaxID=230809 RepID=A0AAD7I1D1_9AGAR|nr:hypothetical protein DFH07DRAFT_141704 [Mycena maculata]
MPAPVTEFILSASSAVEDLVYLNFEQHNPSLLDILGTSSLKRLSCGLSTDIFESVAHIDFSRPLFSHITHLELFDEMHVVDVDIWSNLALVPCLTHLRLWSPSLALILSRTCNSLRVLMVIRQPFEEASETELRELAQDPRFVQMTCPEFVKDWQMGALTGVDYWSQGISSRSGSRAKSIVFSILLKKARVPTTHTVSATTGKI